MTKEVSVDCMSGKRRRSEGSDIMMVQEIREVCEMESDSVGIYTDRSKQENGLAVGREVEWQ